MIKILRSISIALLVSMVLAFNGLAMPDSQSLTLPNNQSRPKDKPKEQPKETPKKDRGGRDRGEKRDKKPDGVGFI